MEKFDFNKAKEDMQQQYRNVEDVDFGILIPDVFGFPNRIPLCSYFGNVSRVFEAEGMVLMEILESMGISPFDAERLIFESPELKADT
jgi:hypothetical protein